jgi:hypothetical protein
MDREWHPRQWFNAVASGETAQWRAVGCASDLVEAEGLGRGGGEQGGWGRSNGTFQMMDLTHRWLAGAWPRLVR